jgi:hypothetical protein
MPEPYRYRNPDGTLRLDELLGEKHVRHYTRILGSSSEEFAAMQLTMAVQAPDQETGYGACAWREPPRGTPVADGWLLTAEGTGPDAASSCQELQPFPVTCWDVCGYYRRLGVPWRATPRQIRLAYLEKDPLSKDERLFYAMSQLVDPEVRRAYDAVPLGGVFMLDRYVLQGIERAAALEASRRNAEAWWRGEDYDEHDRHKDVVAEWGFEKVSPQEAHDRATGKSGAFRHGTASDELGSSRSQWERQWSYYRLTSPDEEAPLPPVSALEHWQAVIAGTLSALGVRLRFSVGIWPGHGQKTLRVGNKSCIFFIGRGVTAQEMANEAARQHAAPDTSY